MDLDGRTGADDDDDYGDGDADADSDADTDADADAGVDLGAESSPQSCGDDWDNDEDGLQDCSDPECMGLVACCDEGTIPVVQDTFDASIDLSRWKRFGDGATETRDSALYPSGDDRFESGVVTLAPQSLAGWVQLSFRIAFPCVQCDELIGVALTARNDYAESSSVEPLAGLVFDGSGDHVRIMLVVNGSVESYQDVENSFFDMTLSIHPDGVVQATDADGWYLNGSAAIDPSVADAYVAIFGRGGGAASAQDVRLLRGPCAAPSAVSRTGADPLMAAGSVRFAPSAVRAPAISGIPGEPGLEMLFTAVAGDGTSIGRAVSADRGVTWLVDPSETPVLGTDDAPVGYVAPDDPALIVRGTIDRIAVVSVAAIGDASSRALVAFNSTDGIEWERLTDRPIPGGSCRSMRHPTLIQPNTTTNGLALYYTCEDADGYGSIWRATTEDDITWSLDAEPVLARDEADEAEVDGVSSPTVLSGDGVSELWYEARSGVRRTLRYAASADGVHWSRWDGTVLSPSSPGAWDSLQVGDPSVVRTGPAELRIFYTGLGPNGQAIGVVTHALPLPEGW